KHTVFPGEAEIAYGLAQRFSGPHRLIQRAALEENSELIAPKPGERVAPTHFGLEQRTHLSQQGVARAVSAGIVDDLELVDVQVAERVGGFTRLGALQRPLEAALELATVDQASEQIVTGVVGEAPVELAGLADVVEHEHAARNVPRPVSNRSRGTLDVELVTVATDEEHRTH